METVTRTRVAAASAGAVTALLLQATLVGPIAVPLAVSLPAVLVAAVALVDGPATGMSFGFAAGLVADLASHHPAGVLALCWLGVGLMCGTLAGRRTLRRDAVIAGIVCGVASSVATVLLMAVHSGGTAWASVRELIPTGVADAALALAVVAVVRWMLHSDSLRASQPVLTDLALGPRRG